MRLDKFLSNSTSLCRKEATLAIRKGRVKIDGSTVTDPSLHIDENINKITIDDSVVRYKKYLYIMLNKPAGYVSSTDDPSGPTVLELLPEELRTKKLFPCGRLDKYTTGLMIMTNDGVSTHFNLSPKHHAEKVYEFTTEKELEHISELESGVHIEGGYFTKPCKITKTAPKGGKIVLTEGKYHQIKQMLHAVGNEIVTLRRISFAGINLDAKLKEGQWRELTYEEELLFKNANQ